MIALISVESLEIIKVYPNDPGWVELPGVGQVSPAVVGWEGDGFKIVAIQPGECAAGYRVTGKAYAYDVEADAVIETFATEAIAAPPVLTAQQKVDRLLADYGLTKEEWDSIMATNSEVAAGGI